MWGGEGRFISPFSLARSPYVSPSLLILLPLSRTHRHMHTPHPPSFLDPSPSGHQGGGQLEKKPKTIHFNPAQSITSNTWKSIPLSLPISSQREKHVLPMQLPVTAPALKRHVGLLVGSHTPTQRPPCLLRAGIRTGNQAWPSPLSPPLTHQQSA